MFKKRLLISALAFAVTLSLVSCKSLQAAAVDIDYSEQAGIYDYFDAYSQQGASFDLSFDTDEDGNRSTRLKIYGIQMLGLQDQTHFYDNLDFSAAPSSVSSGQTSGVGAYISSVDNHVHAVTLCRATLSGTGSASALFAVSDEFNLTISAEVPGANFVVLRSESFYEPPNQYHDDFRSGCNISGDYNQINIDFTASDSRGYFINSAYNRVWVQTGSIPVYASLSASSLGVLSRTLSSGYYPTVGYLGQTITTPTATYDTSKPWDYYNDTILPYLQDQFPGYEEYFFFPDGYQPPEPAPTIPTEQPTLPGYDFFPAEDGTLPSDAQNIAYDSPTFPGKDITVPSFDFTSLNPSEIMAPLANGLSGIWALITDTLGSFDLFPIVGIAIFTAIVAILLSLGR